ALTPPRPGSLTPSPCTTLFRSYPQLWAARDDAVSVGALSLLPGISVTTSAAGSNSPNSPPSRRTRSGAAVAGGARLGDSPANTRSEEHTSALQSRENTVCRLLL